MVLLSGTLAGPGTPPNIGCHKEQRWRLGPSQKFERHPGAWADLIDKICLLHETSLSRLGQVVILPNTQKPTQTVKENEETQNVFQTKELEKTNYT